MRLVTGIVAAFGHPIYHHYGYSHEYGHGG